MKPHSALTLLIALLLPPLVTLRAADANSCPLDHLAKPDGQTSNAIQTAVAAGTPESPLLNEGFEEPEALAVWQRTATFTAAGAEVVSPGQLSEHCLRLHKPDMCGTLMLRRRLPLKKAGYYRLTADLKSVMVRPYSRYFMMVSRFSGGKPLTPNLFFPYNDGLMMDNAFGGTLKTPQTLGEWRTTEHIFRLEPGVDEIDLAVIVEGSQQELLLDHVRLAYVGSDPQARNPVRVSAKRINWPYAELDLDMLLPLATYEVRANCIRPKVPAGFSGGLAPNAKPSPEMAPPGFHGMGIAMRALDFAGNLSAQTELVPSATDGDTRTYLLTVPETAVSVQLNLHNDDLVRFDHNQIEAQARRWGDVEIRLVANGVIADDNQYHQYVYHKKREDLRPRSLPALSDFDLTVLKTRLLSRSPLAAVVMEKDGGLCLSLGGRPVPPLIAHTTSWGADYQRYGQLTRNGVRLITCRYPYCGPAMHGDWQGPREYDFADLDKALYRALAPNPDAAVILVVDDAVPPYWWALENPDDLVQDQRGAVVYSSGRGLYDRVYVAREKMAETFAAKRKADTFNKAWGAANPGYFLPSPASAKYHADMTEFLTALRRHIEAQPYGNAVVGYWFTWGYDGQWHMVNDPLPGHTQSQPFPHYTDYSPAMQARFRDFLKKRYGTDANLQAAWHDPAATLGSAALPDPARCDLDQEKGNDYLLDPAQDQRLIDYRVCEAQCIGETLNALCAAVKRAGPRPVLTVAYYPDIKGNCTGAAGRQSGHDVVLGEPWLDLAGNPGYEGREIGQVGTTGLTAGSYPLHGKIPMTEIDHRLFTVLRRNYRNNIVFETPRKSIDVLRREFSAAICRNGGAWFFDMGYGWFDDPIIGATVGQACQLFDSVLTCDRRPIGQMAVFYGEEGKNAQADARRGGIPQLLVARTSTVLGHAGLPIDEYRMSDLPRVAGQYKVFYFPFAYALSATELEAINALKRDGNLLVFGPAAGLVSDSRKALAQVEALTGMQMAEAPGLSLTVEFRMGTHPLGAGLTGFMGTAGARHAEAGMPRLYVTDPKAVTIATYAGTDKAGVAFKDIGAWQSVYVGAIGLVPPEFLRNLGRFKGLHVYCDSGDPMYFCRSLVGIHAGSDGAKEIVLPQESEVTSLWDAKALGRVQRFTRPMHTGETALYLVTPSATTGSATSTN